MIVRPGRRRSRVDQLALEFEASGLDPKLLELFPSKTVLFGCIDNEALDIERVESPEQVEGVTEVTKDGARDLKGTGRYVNGGGRISMCAGPWSRTG